MKKLFITLLLMLNILFIPINTYAEEQIKETINKENETGMKITLICSSIIVLIAIIYKKKKITI